VAPQSGRLSKIEVEFVGLYTGQGILEVYEGSIDSILTKDPLYSATVSVNANNNFNLTAWIIPSGIDIFLAQGVSYTFKFIPISDMPEIYGLVISTKDKYNGGLFCSFDETNTIAISKLNSGANVSVDISPTTDFAYITNLLYDNISSTSYSIVKSISTEDTMKYIGLETNGLEEKRAISSYNIYTTDNIIKTPIAITITVNETITEEDFNKLRIGYVNDFGLLYDITVSRNYTDKNIVGNMPETGRVVILPISDDVTPTPTVSASSTPTTTPTATPSETPTQTPTQTRTPTISNSATPTRTPTISNSGTSTPTISKSATPTPTISKSATPTPTISNSATPTISNSATPTPTISNSATPTVSNSATPTLTVSHSATPTISNSATSTPTISNSATPTPTISNSATPTSTTGFVDFKKITFAAYGFKHGYEITQSTGLGWGILNCGTTGERSYYGTYDQDGNLYEYVEDVANLANIADFSNFGRGRVSLGGSIMDFPFYKVPTRYFNQNVKESRVLNPSHSLSLYGEFSRHDTTLQTFRVIRTSSPPSNEISLWSYVGDINNPNDTADRYFFTNNNILSPILGKVSYNYWIKNIPITQGEFVNYLNIVDSTGSNLLNMKYHIVGQKANINTGVPYDEWLYGNYIQCDTSRSVGLKYYIAREKSNNKPVCGLNWIHAARYCNWVTNGSNSSSSTENGAYLIQNESSTDSITRSNATTCAIPNINEWYKAAYYNPIHNRYFKFATQSDRLPQPCGVDLLTENGIPSVTTKHLYVHFPGV
jgi:hypothetical protein